MCLVVVVVVHTHKRFTFLYTSFEYNTSLYQHIYIFIKKGGFNCEKVFYDSLAHTNTHTQPVQSGHDRPDGF